MDDRALDYLISQRINMFNGAMDKDISHTVKISAVLTAIKQGRWKSEIEWLSQEEDEDERADIKRRFPCVTFSGLFHTKRAAENLDKYSHIMVVDIDNMEMSFDKTMKCVQGCHFIFAAFKSPSGGIKALAYSRMKAKNHRDILFVGIEEYMMDQFGIQIDKSGKDVSRLCFISYDPELYLSPEGKCPFNLQEDAPKTFWSATNDFKQVRTTNHKEFEKSFDMDHIMEWSVKWAAEKTGGFAKGSRNNYIFYLACILNRAGVSMERTTEVLLNRYNSIKKELPDAVKSAYKHNKHEFGKRPIWQHKSPQTKIME